MISKMLDIPNEEYHKLPAVSSSGLVKLVQGTPAHYQAYLNEPREVTPAMELGTAIHAAVLEPDLFHATYIQKPEDMSFATKEGKAWKEANQGKKILTPEQFRAVSRITDSVMAQPIASRVILDGMKEKSFVWVDKETGIPCKCRPDIFAGNKVFDLKTTEDASARGFQRSIMSFGMHIQSAFYLMGVSELLGEGVTDFIHIAVEKKPPYAVALYVLDDASLERARLDIRKALRTLAECEETGKYPAYSEEIQTMNLPAWAFEEA